MSEHETGFEPTDPSVEDDLLSPETPGTSAGEHEAETGAQPGPGSEEPAPSPPASSYARQLVRAAWVLVIVVAVIGAIAAAELVRVSTALSNSECIQRAQAQLLETLGPGVTGPYAALGRLSAQDQLKKCGQ